MDILLLTRSECAFCGQAKEMLERLSTEYQFSLRLLDLDSAAGQVAAEAAGVLFPPGILINGEPFCYGRPSERKLRREFDRRQNQRA